MPAPTIRYATCQQTSCNHSVSICAQPKQHDSDSLEAHLGRVSLRYGVSAAVAQHTPVLEFLRPPTCCTQQGLIWHSVLAISHFKGNATHPPMPEMRKVYNRLRCWNRFAIKQTHMVIPIDLQTPRSNHRQMVPYQEISYCHKGNCEQNKYNHQAIMHTMFLRKS